MREVLARDVQETEALGARLAAGLRPGLVIFLRGPLGAGKTSFVRGVLHALGIGAHTKSPTFTLVEPYGTAKFPVYHFDLYRLKDPEELEFLGFRDYLDGSGVILMEWPERGMGFLPSADIEVVIEPCAEGRRLHLQAHTAAGERVLEAFA